MNYAKKVLLILLGVFLIPGLFLLFVSRPQGAKYRELQLRERELNRQINEANEEIARLPATREKIRQLHGQLKKIKEQYPRTIEPFYEQISRTANEVGMNIMAMFSVPQPPRKEEESLAVEERFVRIQGRCSYRVLGNFLEKIFQLPVVVSVADLEVEGKKGILPRLKVELILTTYLTRND